MRPSSFPEQFPYAEGPEGPDFMNRDEDDI
jgi:hypothetical protein